MNNDELQKAIDDITRDSAPAEAPVDSATSVAENEQLANELAAVPGAPVTGARVDVAPVQPEFAAAPAPEVPAEPAMPPMPGMVAPAVPEATAPEAVAAPAAGGANEDTLSEAYRALYPLLDKVEMPVEEKFDITLRFGEPAKALELAKQIADEGSRAKALLELVNKLK
ncbi:hypothetical protein IKE71_01125 [Candidatus Saccharibacteria bacterium]|nr:hypothetical protein [Candidatus Saccharibacteria bacterium]